MRRSVPGAAALLAAPFLVAPAGAQSLTDHFWLEATAYRPSVDTDVSLSSRTSGNPGSRIDLESDLHLAKKKTLPAFVAGARLGGGFSIAAEYYSLGRSASADLSRDIVFDDVTYPAHARVASRFDTDIYRLTLGYAFIRRRQFEIGGALGLHATNVVAELSGQGHIGSAATQQQTRRDSFLAPLPTLGLFATVEPMPRLILNGRVDYLSLKIDKYDGRLVNAQISASYRFLKNAGIGIAYRYVDYRIDVLQPRTRGRFAYRFNGPALFVQFGF